MSTPGSWRGVLAHYRTKPHNVQAYFCHLPALAGQFPWDVSIAYLFSRVELGHHMTLYCATVKQHRADASLAWQAIEKREMNFPQFLRSFAAALGQPLALQVTTMLNQPRKVRNKVVHGKPASEAEKRHAVCSVLDYAVAYNDFVDSIAGFRPFGPLRGFKGKAKSVNAPSTQALLKKLKL